MNDVDAMYENWASDPLVAKGAGWPKHENRLETEGIVSRWVENYLHAHT
jgi:hypothetical protein